MVALPNYIETVFETPRDQYTVYIYICIGIVDSVASGRTGRVSVWKPEVGEGCLENTND